MKREEDVRARFLGQAAAAAADITAAMHYFARGLIHTLVGKPVNVAEISTTSSSPNSVSVKRCKYRRQSGPIGGFKAHGTLARSRWRVHRLSVASCEARSPLHPPHLLTFCSFSFARRSRPVSEGTAWSGKGQAKRWKNNKEQPM